MSCHGLHVPERDPATPVSAFEVVKNAEFRGKGRVHVVSVFMNNGVLRPGGWVGELTVLGNFKQTAGRLGSENLAGVADDHVETQTVRHTGQEIA